MYLSYLPRKISGYL